MFEEEKKDNIEEVNQQPEIISKKEKWLLAFKLSGFIICSVVYLICRQFDRFKKLTDADISSHQTVTYTQSIMSFTHVMSIIVIIIGILFLVNIFFPLKFKITSKNLKTSNSVVDWLLILPICVTISTFLFTFVFTITVVNGSSMEPTIYSNDQLVLVYDNSIERFDVVVIDVSPEYYDWYGHKYFLKRIIGLPGDKVEYVQEGAETVLYINGQKVNESFYSDNVDLKYKNTYTRPSSNQFNWEEVCSYKQEGEVKYCPVVEGSIVIPEGYYFVLGDNRLVSQDSRSIGLVRFKDILGTARYRMHSIINYERIK